MTAVALDTTLPIFTGLDGKPLSGGAVYIGQPNQDPRTFPAAAYWDSALSIPAAQPLATSAGYVVRTGAPSPVYVNNHYSLLVLDAAGQQVVYVADCHGALATFSDFMASVLEMGNAADARTALGVSLRGQIDGLTLSTAGSSATFSVAAGVAADSTNAILMQQAASISKTTAAWSAGSGVGALDTGAISPSTWYHIHVIRRPDTGATDVLISLSATAPTLPANYTQWRRIGSLRTNGSSQWTKFSQLGDEFLWDVPVVDASLSTLGTAGLSIALTAPPGVKVHALLTGYALSATAAVQVNLYSPDITDTAAAASTATTIVPVANGYGPINTAVRTGTSAQIRAISSAASTTIAVATRGWVDLRGKNA